MLDLSKFLAVDYEPFNNTLLKEISDQTNFLLKASLLQGATGILNDDASVSIEVSIYQTNFEKRPKQFKFEEKTHTQILYCVSGERGFNIIKEIFNNSFNEEHQFLFASQHPKNAKLRDCILKDLSAFPVMYSLKDAESLQEGQVIGLSLNRGAEFGINFSWSNIISRSISELTGLGVDPKTISLDIKPSLFVDLKYSLDDSLFLLAKKSKDDRIEFAVTKASQKQGDINAGIKVNLKLSDNKVFQQLLNDTGDQVIEAMLGTKLKHLDALLKDTKQTKENIKIQTWYPILSKLTEKDLYSLEIPDIRKELEAVKSNIIEKIQTAISKNTELAIKYEYKKTKSSQEVFHFELPIENIQDYHQKLIGFKLSKVLEDYRVGKLPINYFLSYLNQKTLKIERSLGLGLTLFGNILFHGKGNDNDFTSVSENIDGHQCIHYQIGSGYKGKLGNWSSEWYSEITLDMNGFSKSPKFKEAEFSQLLSQSSGGKIIIIEDLEKHLDTGVIWGAILPMQRTELANSLLQDFKSKTIEVQNTIMIHGEGFRSFLNQLSWTSKNHPWRLKSIIANSLATALPYLPEYEVRREIEKRAFVYKSAFMHLLNNSYPSNSSMTDSIAKNILEVGPKTNENIALSGMEKNASPSMFLHTLSKNNKITEKWNAVGSHYEQLYDATSNNLEIPGNFKIIEKAIRTIPSSTLNCRALGALMNYFAQHNEEIALHTSRYVEIILEDGKTFILSSI